MAKLAHSDTKRMYSWWWDSHISPKNSKWLQENLTDVDAKVKSMIKLIEEDADSFARRAEMYYKKRPELMKLVEELYRAYRALAERYDHATGVIRHAHRTMAEAFPNQVPLIFADDSPASSVSGHDPRTPEMSTPARSLFEMDDYQKDGHGLSSSHSHSGKRNGELTDEADSATRRKGFKQVNDVLMQGKVRKGLNFNDAEEKERSFQNNENHSSKDQTLSRSEQVGDTEEISILKEALAKLEAEKEAGFVQYQQSLDKLSKLESDISHAQEDSLVLSDRATKAEGEVATLKDALSKLEAEKEANLQAYHQCLDKISDLENAIVHSQDEVRELNERAGKAESEALFLKVEVAKVVSEKDVALDRYMQSLEMITNLENKLHLAEENARSLNERAEKAESEVESLKQTIIKLTEEKDAAELQYQKCLETISELQEKLRCAEEEAQRLSVEIDNGVSKLKGAEEQCLLLERSNQSLHSELESLMLKMGTQTQELTEKQKELGRLWACVQEERLRFVEAETAFQTLQHLHSQTQEELRLMASELQKRAQVLKDVEIHNKSLQDEVLKVEEENKNLNDLNASSALSIENMQNEISSLRETKGKLEEEVEIRVDQRNALQQEIYCLKEELNDMGRKHLSILEQVHAVGLNPESLGSSVKELQDENSSLKETCDRERSEKAALLEKLEVLEQLLEKNSILETSLSDLNAELEAVREKIVALEQSCQSLLEEKSTLAGEKATLTTQLQLATENLEKLSEKNTVLENSLFDAHDELRALKTTSKSLEDSCHLLANQKAELLSEKDGLVSQLETTQLRLEELRGIYEELGRRYTHLEKEKESTLLAADKLQKSLDMERQEHASFVQMSEMRLNDIESKMHLVGEESEYKQRALDEVLDDALCYEIEIFVLKRTARELENHNCSLSIKNGELLEKSRFSEKLISDLQQNNFEQKVEIKSLVDQTSNLRRRTSKMLKALNIVEDHVRNDIVEQDQVHLNKLWRKLLDMKESLWKAEEDNQQITVELSVLLTLLGRLRLDAESIVEEKNSVDHELKTKTHQLLLLESEVLKLHGMNEELKSKLREGDEREVSLLTEIEDLQRKLLDMEGACQELQRENLKIHEQKRSLTHDFLHLKNNNHILEEENCALCGKILTLDVLSMVFRSSADEERLVLRELGNELSTLHDVNGGLMEKLSTKELTLEELQMENVELKERLKKLDDELRIVITIKDQVSDEIETEKNKLHQKELEFQEAEKKIRLIELEKLELHEIVGDLQSKYSEIKRISNDQENKFLELSSENGHLNVENHDLQGANKALEVELRQLHEDRQKMKSQEETLRSEVNMWETQAATLLSQLQSSAVVQLLYERKVHEIHETCERFMDENEGLRTQLAAYGPEIISLKECISSLENSTRLSSELGRAESEKLECDPVVSEFSDNQNGDVRAPERHAVLDLKDLQARVQVIEKAAIEVEQLLVKENSDLHSKLEAAMRQIEELQSESNKYRRHLTPTSEISEAESALLTKDIMLDQISECSSYGISRREHAEPDVEIWEGSYPDGSIGLNVGKPKKMDPHGEKNTDLHRIKSVKKQKGVRVSEASVDKELSVEKLGASKRSTESLQEGNKRKVLERLNSDVQKLANLQITVQDLKRKLEITEKNKRGKAVLEWENLKGQLDDVEISILKLFDINNKLIKNIEDSSFSDMKSSFDSEEDGNVRRRRVVEQARRVSEKIGRLQLDVQKLQFVMLKFDDENEGRGRSRLSETKRRTLLRDYLYGGARTNHRRKKAHFCACIQPSTAGD